MIIDREYAIKNKAEIFQAIRDGKIFIYPTDTIYGIGCNALDEFAVKKIRALKQRELKPFSIIVPNHTWIKTNCMMGDETERHLAKLPGPYTLFMNLKNRKLLPETLNPKNDGTIGIRIPRHWFSEILSEVNTPFVTTSVNISGKPYMTSLENLNENIRSGVDYIIYDGPILGEPSTKINLIIN